MKDWNWTKDIFEHFRRHFLLPREMMSEEFEQTQKFHTDDV